MRIFGRLVLSGLVLLGSTGAFVSCSDDETSGGEDPPATANDILEVTGAGAAAVPVVDNDRDLDHEPLTFSIEEAPTVGSASFNSDRTVRLDLPAGFRGVTRFKYKITNSLGGFSISTAVVFVDVPAYRVLFAAQNSAQALELYATDLISEWQVSKAASGNFRLRNAWRSETGSMVVYERADAAQASAPELFYVRVTSDPNPVKIQPPGGRSFISGSPVSISPNDRWLAFPTAPATGPGQATNLYVLDTNGGSARLVSSSANLLTDTVQWSGGRVYFMAAPGGTTTAVYRAATDALESPERISPAYPGQDTHDQLLVSPDETKVLVLGTHNGQNGAFFIDPATPNAERRLTSDMPAGALIESFHVNETFTQLAYVWRAPGAAIPRLSVVPIRATGVPSTILTANITALTDTKADGSAALVTVGTNGPSTDGTLYEVPLDGSGDEVRIANAVAAGLYDDTGDRVFLFSNSSAPAVIARADFDRNGTPLVRSSTPANALFVVPESARSAAIIEDPTRGLVLVNAAAPGNTLRLTSRAIGTLPPTLLPTAIEP